VKKFEKSARKEGGPPLSWTRKRIWRIGVFIQKDAQGTHGCKRKDPSLMAKSGNVSLTGARKKKSQGDVL